MSSSAGEGSPEERPAPGLAAETAARALALASALSATLTEIARRLDQYSAFGKRSRRIITALAVSFSLDIILTVVLGFTAFSAHDTASANTRLVREAHAAQVALHAAQLQACAAGNIFRANQTTIWRDFISLAAKPSPGEPAAQVAKTNALAAGFLAHVATVNHPVNCARLYGK